MTNADRPRRPGRAVAALVVGAAVLGACGGGDGGSESSKDEVSASGAPPTLDVLVTNDAGYDAVGIDAVVEALRDEPGLEVTVVAPATDQSRAGDKTTAGPVAHSEKETASGYPAVAVEGFPADSVLVALGELGLTPDLVVSGIGAGEDIGPLAGASGTVGAAKTAQRMGLPALAVSQGADAEDDDYAATADLVVGWVHDHRGELDDLANTGEVTSLNVPTCPDGEVRGMVDVALATDGSDVGDTVDCESTEDDFSDDVSAFLNGYAALTQVPAGDVSPTSTSA
jgi:5'-nucleotidase